MCGHYVSFSVVSQEKFWHLCIELVIENGHSYKRTGSPGLVFVFFLESKGL